jgi:hypothetical protein
LGEKKRTSFETVFVVHDELEIVKAEAVGKHGRVLASTDVVKSEPEVQQFQAEVENKEEQESDGCLERFLRMGWGFLRNQEL